MKSAIDSGVIAVKGDPQTLRSYLHQETMAQWILAELTHRTPTTDLQIGSTIPVSILELAEYIATKANARVHYPLEYEPGDKYIPTNSNTPTKLGLTEGKGWKSAVDEMIESLRMGQNAK
jgi:nucleoside-diphosphate-sugar epimerase